MVHVKTLCYIDHLKRGVTGVHALHWQMYLSQARFPFKRNRLRCVRCVNENRKKRKCLRWQAFSRNKRKRQPIGMLGRSSGNHDWLLANASDCV